MNIPSFSRHNLPMLLLIIIVLIGAVLVMNWYDQEQSALVMYVAHDRSEEVEQLIQTFERQHDVNIMTVWDTEETEPVGTALRLANEPNPLADVYFGSEAMRTIFLKEQGKLAPLDIPTDNMIYADADKTWFGIVAERIGIIYDESEFNEEPGLDTLRERTACISDPYYGSTLNYLILLRDRMGEQTFNTFFTNLKEEGRVTASDFRSAQLVKRGVCDVGIAEYDDAKENDLAFSDTDDLTFPNTISVVKKDDLHPKAPALVKFLIKHEQTLAEAEMAPVLKKNRTALDEQVDWQQLYDDHYATFVDTIK